MINIVLVFFFVEIIVKWGRNIMRKYLSYSILVLIVYV